MEINNTAELKIMEDINSHSLSAYPTPFTNSMTLNYMVKTDGNYQVNLYDMTGRLVRNLHTGHGQAGTQERLELDGRVLKSGIYLIAITNGTERQTIRVVKKE
jgi:aerobic-type carbon monoxide dehydrogenase small subunit (CoxS/CutS family)